MFDLDKNYRNKCLIWSPKGMIHAGEVFSGEQWKDILFFEVGKNSFNNMFEIVE